MDVMDVVERRRGGGALQRLATQDYGRHRQGHESRKLAGCQLALLERTLLHGPDRTTDQRDPSTQTDVPQGGDPDLLRYWLLGYWAVWPLQSPAPDDCPRHQDLSAPPTPGPAASLDNASPPLPSSDSPCSGEEAEAGGEEEDEGEEERAGYHSNAQEEEGSRPETEGGR
ncbi:unnamed protein product [Gadus morhua 'NCC']